MNDKTLFSFLKKVVKNTPQDWIKLTTHRLDIYNEEFAKTQFLEAFEDLIQEDRISNTDLANLPTAYDYIRLGHPLSSILEWSLAQSLAIPADHVISFSSKAMPIYAILRENKIIGKATNILVHGEVPDFFQPDVLREVYGYDFNINLIENLEGITDFEGSQILISNSSYAMDHGLHEKIDFHINIYHELGSIVIIQPNNKEYISSIQHVRRRESIAMTPQNCFKVLENMVGLPMTASIDYHSTHEKTVLQEIASITGSSTPGLLASSGLSMQYAIVMGLIDEALATYPNQEIALVVPPNCYGGTNDQARRVADSLAKVSVVDLPVDGENDMVDSLEIVLSELAIKNHVPFIIVEIPTNPRVEVPNMVALEATLSKTRLSKDGKKAIAPVFILDQTFCPNTSFLRDQDILSSVKTLAYVSGSKFPSGGKCTAGYCVANSKGAYLMSNIEKHLAICDNRATRLQTEILAEQLPTMTDRIAKAYQNTQAFVDFIQNTLPTAKINFVSKDLVAQDFTPSVFSLDLPTKGNTPEAREKHKRMLNLQLIDMMISKIPNESKHCVSYGQLKGCYWTIPATSTQGTTKESDKDYIARVSVSPHLDLEKHKAVFAAFVEKYIN